MNHYFVTTPDYSGVTFVNAFEPNEPRYAGCFVDAANKGEAKKMAIKHPNMRDYVEQQRGDGCSPFTGLKVELATCPHGKCFCDKCNEECEECDAEAAVTP